MTVEEKLDLMQHRTANDGYETSVLLQLCTVITILRKKNSR